MYVGVLPSAIVVLVDGEIVALASDVTVSVKFGINLVTVLSKRFTTYAVPTESRAILIGP
ncbi:unannotated protein [freshwater metagenome]|uniref:Unannotated protein n=1 Tax=freshwater metagenome TaxID=449393 RepID=A0A6J6VI38_9ZZZZ